MNSRPLSASSRLKSFRLVAMTKPLAIPKCHREGTRPRAPVSSIFGHERRKGTQDCHQARRERPRRPARISSSSSSLEQTLRRDVSGLFRVFPDFLHSGEDLLQAAFGLWSTNDGGKLATTADAGAFDQFRELLLGFEKAYATHPRPLINLDCYSRSPAVPCERKWQWMLADG